MSFLEHEDKKEDCGCPTCFVGKQFFEEYERYKRRKPYLTFVVETNTVEEELNKHQLDGYELTYIVLPHGDEKRIAVMRSVPPQQPTAADIVIEYNKRVQSQKEADKPFPETDMTPGNC